MTVRHNLPLGRTPRANYQICVLPRGGNARARGEAGLFEPRGGPSAFDQSIPFRSMRLAAAMRLLTTARARSFARHRAAVAGESARAGSAAFAAAFSTSVAQRSALSLSNSSNASRTSDQRDGAWRPGPGVTTRQPGYS